LPRLPTRKLKAIKTGFSINNVKEYAKNANHAKSSGFNINIQSYYKKHNNL